MSVHPHPLDETEELGRPLAFSAAFHAALFGVSVIWSALYAPISLGDPMGQLGGAVAVNIVQGVPLPVAHLKLENPVANPVTHDVPELPEAAKAAVEKVAEDDPGAVPIETRAKKQSRRPEPKPAATRKTSPPKPSHQLGSSTGAAVSSPIYTGAPGIGGSGGVGFGSGSPFGARFGWYAEALQRRLAEEWRKTLGQVEASSSKPAVISFRILRSGVIDNVRVAESSGNRSLDYSAVRAVINSSPMQPLPHGLGRSSISVEIWFQLRL